MPDWLRSFLSHQLAKVAPITSWVLVLLILGSYSVALFAYDIPRFRSQHKRGSLKWDLDLIVYLIALLMLTAGAIVGVAGLTVAELNLQGPVDAALQHRLDGIGTGLTIYAAALAVVVLTGRRSSALPAADFSGDRQTENPLKYELQTMQAVLAELRDGVQKLRRFMMISLFASSVAMCIAIILTLSFWFSR